MDTDMNVPQGEGLGQGNEPGYDYQGGYVPVYRKPWFWIIIAAVVVCAAVAAFLLLSGGAAPQSFELTGNAGVVAAYDFFCQQQESQDKLASNISKDLGKRLESEPFEIESTMEMDMGDFGEGIMPLSNISVGIDAKYDLKDFGIKIRTMGVEVIGAYLIENNVVVSLMGKAGSMPVEFLKDVNIKKNMGLGERIKEFLPFLPEDEVYMALLEKTAQSIPDKYTVTDSVMAYSPKDDKEVLMDVITTALDSQAIKEVIGKFADELKNDKKLSRQLQDIIDSFTDIAGMEKEDIEGLIKDLEESADSEALKDMSIAWSVYSRDGSYVGIGFDISAGDTKIKYEYMNEIDGNESYAKTSQDINGLKSESVNKSVWSGDKIEFSGETSTIVSEGAGNTTQLIDGVMEFSKQGSEYTLSGDFSIKGDAYNDIINSGKTMSVDMSIDAEINVGGGLGTLKEDREWDDIYKKDWGKMEDLFKGLFPSGSFFNYDTGNTL